MDEDEEKSTLKKIAIESNKEFTLKTNEEFRLGKFLVLINNTDNNINPAQIVAPTNFAINQYKCPQNFKQEKLKAI